MKLLPLLSLSAFFFTLAARADLTIVQKIEGGGPINEMTIKIKGDKARVEISPEMTTIIDSKTGDVTTLMNSQKQFMRISGETTKAYAAMAKQAMAKPDGEKIKLTATGKKETINGFETEEYTGDTASMKGTYSIATHYPDYAAILKQLQSMQSGSFGGMNKGMPDYRDFPGLPIRTHVKMEGQGEFTSTISSIKQDAIPDTAFAAPVDFHEMKMPAFPGAKPPAAGKHETGD